MFNKESVIFRGHFCWNGKFSSRISKIAKRRTIFLRNLNYTCIFRRYPSLYNSTIFFYQVTLKVHKIYILKMIRTISFFENLTINCPQKTTKCLHIFLDSIGSKSAALTANAFTSYEKIVLLVLIPLRTNPYYQLSDFIDEQNRRGDAC